MGAPPFRSRLLEAPLYRPQGPRRCPVGPSVGPPRGATWVAGHGRFDMGVILAGLVGCARQ
eukprot:14834415-Alexandrium_andersonii.AAC.1